MACSLQRSRCRLSRQHPCLERQWPGGAAAQRTVHRSSDTDPCATAAFARGFSPRLALRWTVGVRRGVRSPPANLEGLAVTRMHSCTRSACTPLAFGSKGAVFGSKVAVLVLRCATSFGAADASSGAAPTSSRDWRPTDVAYVVRGERLDTGDFPSPTRRPLLARLHRRARCMHVQSLVASLRSSARAACKLGHSRWSR